MIDPRNSEENGISVECGGTNESISIVVNTNTNEANEESTHADLEQHEHYQDGEKQETSINRNLLQPFAKLKSFVVPKVERIPFHMFILLTFFIALP